MRPIRAGGRRQSVLLFDVPELTTDPYGEPSLSPTQIMGPGIGGSFHARVRPLKGDEMLNVRQIFPTATHQVEMGWLGSAIPVTSDNPQGLILPQMYLIVTPGQGVLNVVFADNVDMLNRMWLLTCEQKIGATA